MLDELNITELYEQHLALNAEMDVIGSWQMPMNYESTATEVAIMREKSGCVDRGNGVIFRFSGKNASQLLDGRLALPVIALGIGGCSENFLLNVKGGVIAHLWVCCMAQDDFLLLANEETANNLANHLAALVTKATKLEELSDYLMRIDVVGAEALQMLQGMSSETLIAPNSCKTVTFNNNLKAIVAGFCEFGVPNFALIFAEEGAIEWWNALITEGIKPCGLLSCEELRVANGACAYGSEYGEDTLLSNFDFPHLFEPLTRRFFGRPALEKAKK